MAVSSEVRPATRGELGRAYLDVLFIEAIPLFVTGMQHAPFIQSHLDKGKHLAVFFTHQAHPDILIARRVMQYVTDKRIKMFAGPASSKLFPGGELAETYGRRMVAYSEMLGIPFYKMVQHYGEKSMSNGKIILRAFEDMKNLMKEEKNVSILYSFEGGRGPGDGILREAQPGTVLLFSKDRNDCSVLTANGDLLGIPVSLEDTRHILDNEGHIHFDEFFKEKRVSIGQPFFAHDLLKDLRQFGFTEKDDLVDYFHHMIGARVASLLPSEFRGYYNDPMYADLVAHSAQRNLQIHP